MGVWHQLRLRSANCRENRPISAHTAPKRQQHLAGVCRKDFTPRAKTVMTCEDGIAPAPLAEGPAA
jgi:hypothetical protein